MYHRKFPYTRLRRLRQTQAIRDLVAENTLTVKDLIAPLFVFSGAKGEKCSIASLPGVFLFDEKSILNEIEELISYGITTIALFPNIDLEDRSAFAEKAYDESGLIPRVLRSIKKHFPEIVVIADVALDPYTSHGHDGLIDDNGYVLNDQSVDVLVKQALVLAESGADILAPSDMMDGRIKAIRNALERVQLQNVLILSYSVKYASSFYGPFREAIGSNKTLIGDKKTYQMNVSNYSEAYHEVSLDLSEGCDCILIKPGLSSLDILAYVKQTFLVPTFVYQVSGEFAMMQQAIQSNLVSESIIIETLSCFKRAGADAIFTYFAKRVAKNLLR